MIRNMSCLNPHRHHDWFKPKCTQQICFIWNWIHHDWFSFDKMVYLHTSELIFIQVKQYKIIEALVEIRAYSIEHTYNLHRGSPYVLLLVRFVVDAALMRATSIKLRGCGLMGHFGEMEARHETKCLAKKYKRNAPRQTNPCAIILQHRREDCSTAPAEPRKLVNIVQKEYACSFHLRLARSGPRRRPVCHGSHQSFCWNVQ